MQCEDVRDQFTDYLGETLAAAVRSEVQKHLIACESCREESETLKGIWMKLGAIPAEKADSAAMRARFDVMLEAYQHGMEHAPASGWWTAANAWIAKWWPQQPALQFGHKDAVDTLRQISLKTGANETVRKHAALALDELR